MRFNPKLISSAAKREREKDAEAAAAETEKSAAGGGKIAPAADALRRIYDAAPQNNQAPREIITEDDEPIITSIFPDVCLTPCGSEMVAIPYNIYAKLDKGTGLTRTIRANGKRIYTLRSIVEGCHGDEAGTGGGVTSGTTGGKCEPITGSRTVRAEGSPIIRDGDLFYMNNRNTIGRVRCVRNTKIYKTPPAYSDEYAQNRVSLALADTDDSIEAADAPENKTPGDKSDE